MKSIDRFATTERRGSPKETLRLERVLQVLYTPGQGLQAHAAHVLGAAPVPLGRAVGAGGIVLDDAAVSRHHATVSTLADGRVLFRDHSSHGSSVEGQRVQGQIALQPPALLRLGDSLVLLRERLLPRIVDVPQLPALLGESDAMAQVRDAVHVVSSSTLTVMLAGESGTGKELVARAIHQLSGRKGAFVAVNCSAIAEQLAESQLFGHVRGAFTGASHDHVGFFRAADGGTLFLDELGELAPSLQPKLLRALEEGCITPVGASRAIACDVRVITATHRNLEDAIEAQAFRRDLYTRLSDFLIVLPSLRERLEDLPILVEAFLAGRAPTVTPDLAEALLLHPWPGNVRELQKVMAELKLRAQGRQELDLPLIQSRLRRSPCRAEETLARTSSPSAQIEPADAPRDASTPPSREQLVALLEAHRANITHIADATGRSRRQIRRYLESHGLSIEHFRSE